MGGLRTLVLALAPVVLLIGCAGRDLERAVHTPPQGSPFDVALSQEYLALARSEHREGDYRDADFFARRSIAAGSGRRFPPEDLGVRRLPADTVGELSEARQRLIATLEAGAADRIPDEAARAQAMFDCWMQEQEENWPFQQGEIVACRDAFRDALARVEAAMRPPPPPPAPPPPAATSHLVFFDLDSAALTPEASGILESVAANAGRSSFGGIVVTGHADRLGSARHNVLLSRRRAEAVGLALVDLGIPPEHVVLDAKGESDPLVPTDDGVEEPQNRRVEIVFR